MSEITRRLFLCSSAAAGAAATSPVRPAAAEPILTPRERLDAAVVELTAAADALWPNANNWIIRIDETPAIPVLISNYDPLASHMTRGGQRNG